ncbi:hypothetical protein [Komagataeibacter europaeus]|uniref:hypothetical protein n=1 Tax=Komagataeibacter europaeus TaxID=33995 RepID=UPI0013A07D8D|nr:hypothetical protein [Komagataeibacter europaeus]
MKPTSVSAGLIMRGTILLIICADLVACGQSPVLPPTAPCAAIRPVLNDSAQVDGYFVISNADMSQLTGYMAALEQGCMAQKE